jgi:hypothetical protein
MKNVDAIVLAVRHVAYLKLEPDRIFKAVGRPFAIIDCFCMLNDAQIRRYLELGCEVKGMGRGTRGSFGSSETGGGNQGLGERRLQLRKLPGRSVLFVS